VILDWVVGHHDLLLVDVAVGREVADDLLCEFGVGCVVGVAVVVERDVELRERLLVGLVPVEGEFLGRDALLVGVDGDRRPVHVRAADEGGLLAERFESAGVHVAADVRSQVADVQVTVGVRQSAGHHRGIVGRKLVVTHWLSVGDGSLKAADSSPS